MKSVLTALIMILVFPVLLCAYIVTLMQWLWNGYDFREPSNRAALEKNLVFEKPYQYSAFTNLDVGRMWRWDENKKAYTSGTGKEYRPSPGDKYYSYKIFNIMPIDAVFKSNDNTILVFQSFDY